MAVSQTSPTLSQTYPNLVFKYSKPMLRLKHFLMLLGWQQGDLLHWQLLCFLGQKSHFMELRKQATVARSSTEAEYKALANTALKQWFQSLLHSLDYHFGPMDGRLKLDWSARLKICVGIARGLAFLHEESTLKIVHRDIKSTNVLLDKDLNPKISDFGLAKLDEEENTHISTRIAGTM
uniref:non-specific serine/threonine protein kinase n=1 Tax=Fagus sylvatica TaxID=28930 RepID=A0A2N9ICP4_FAGSY